MSCGLNIWQFPHSREEFPPKCDHRGQRFSRGVELLAHWLDHEFRVEQRGEYDVIRLARYRKVQPSDVVLFVKDRCFAGVGVVKQPAQDRTKTAETLAGTWGTYEGYLVIDSETLRVFEAPVPQEIIESVELPSGKVIPGFGGPAYRGLRSASLLNERQHQFVENLLQGLS